MARIAGVPRVDLDIQIRLNESETRALDALAGYGSKEFAKAFYSSLGEAYMKQHEAGLISFLDSIRTLVPPILAQLDTARKVFNGENRDG